MDAVCHPDSVEALQARLLEIATEAMDAWHGHMLVWAESLINNLELGFENQYAERLDAFDTFIEGLRYDETSPARDIKAELQEAVHVPLRLNDETIEGLFTGSQKAIDLVVGQIRSTLMQISIRRLILTFERQFSDNWNIKATELSDQSWSQVHTTLMDRVSDTLDRRRDYVLGESGEISRDLDANQELLVSALDDPAALMRVLILLTQGRVIAFDERTHQRMFKGVVRLRYFFKAADLLGDEPAETLQEQILQHLEVAQDKFAEVLGATELLRLHNAGQTLENLNNQWQEHFSEIFGNERLQAMHATPLDQLPQSVTNELRKSLGRYIQNHLYRQLLLSKISELWVDYLTKVEALRVSVRMEAYGQRDPLVIYKNQATAMFSGLLSDIRAGVIAQMFRARLVSRDDVQKTQSAPEETAAKPAPAGRQRHKKKGRKRH